MSILVRFGIPAAVIAFGVVLSGCQSAPAVEVDPSLNAENAGTLFVYRPASEWMGQAIDFRVTLDGQYVGSLETGGGIETYATPGEHSITVQPYFLSIPDGKPSTAKIETRPGESVYIRFSQHVDEVIVLPGFGWMSGHLELQEVPLEVWEKKL